MQVSSAKDINIRRYIFPFAQKKELFDLSFRIVSVNSKDWSRKATLIVKVMKSKYKNFRDKEN